VLLDVVTDLAKKLREEGALDESGCFIDTTFGSAKGGAKRSIRRNAVKI
jgi:hypothetical protein